jgi:hypothetical protein
MHSEFEAALLFALVLVVLIFDFVDIGFSVLFVPPPTAQSFGTKSTYEDEHVATLTIVIIERIIKKPRILFK